jgi:hypothetical protein
MAIRADLLAVPRDQRPRLKGLALAQLSPRRVTRGAGDVEIQSITAIDSGVELLIRAWRPNGLARGFGDGSVEIERIRISNPPICVPDPAGDIDLSFTDDDGTPYTRRFREDLDEALLQVLDHVLRVVPTHGPERIQRGRVGRTVSTFYAGGGDGYVENDNTVWDTAHDAVTGTFADATTNPFRVQTGLLAGEYSFRRGLVPIDTSTLPDTDVISAATFSLFVSALSQNGDNDGTDWWVPVGPTTQADPTTIGTADFDQVGAIDNPTEFSNDRKDYGSHTLSTYADWVFNASGLANISQTSYTLIGVREGHDCTDSVYAGANNTSNQIRYASSEATGTTTDPVLVVTHAAPSSAAGPLIGGKLVGHGILRGRLVA